MKVLVSTIFCFLSLYVYSQSKDSKALEVDDNGNIIIYCNATKNTNLFFSFPIENGTLGSDNFQFGFDKDNNGKIAIVRGINGPETNLLVTTLNGDIYSFVVKYKAEISKFNYFVKSENRIGNINGVEEKEDEEQVKSIDITEDKPQKNDNLKEVPTVTFNDYDKSYKSKKIKKVGQNEENLYELDKEKYYQELSQDVVVKGVFYKRFYAEATGVKFHLSNIVYDKEELYFYLTIDNQSTIDYDINFLHFYISASNKNRATSTQKIKSEPVFIYGDKEKVAQGEKVDFVYVFKKFTINKEKKIEISLSEVTGERDLVIEVSNQYINNPNLK